MTVLELQCDSLMIIEIVWINIRPLMVPPMIETLDAAPKASYWNSKLPPKEYL